MNEDHSRAEPTAEQRDAARRNAQDHFTTRGNGTEFVKVEVARALSESDAKTARLRALRLAKEEAERLAAQSARTMARPTLKLSKFRRKPNR
jgi:hypothetical protein